MSGVDSLGWTLIHFLWQGTVVALLLAAADHVLARATARVRYTVACAALLTMLMLVAGTFAVLRAGGTMAGSAPLAVSSAGIVAAPLVSALAVERFAPFTATDATTAYLPALVTVWLIGVCLLALRSAGGWMVARHLAVRRAWPVAGEWQARVARMAARLAVSRPVRLCESALADVPMVIGWMRPVILLPASALTGLTPQQLEAVLAHELAHVRRHDYLVNLLQTAAETLLFYHPAVWWTGRRIRIEREHCCDDLAVEACGDALVYARALAQLEHVRRDTPHFAMAATRGSLVERIQRLVGAHAPSDHVYGGRVAVAVVAGLLAVGATSYASFTGDWNRDPAPAPAGTAPTSGAIPALSPEAAQADAAASTSDTSEGVAQTPTSPPQADRDETADTPSRAASSGGFIDSLAAAGYRDLSVDQLIALKVHGVTSELVQRLRAEGFEPTVDDLVSVRVHGVTPEFVSTARAAGLTPSLEQLIALRVHGVDFAVVSEMARLGYTLDTDQVVSMHVHGVTPAVVETARRLGLERPTFDQLISMRVHGVTPALLESMVALGVGTPTFDHLIALKVHNVTAEYATAMQQAGLRDLDLNGLVQLSVHGVTAEQLRELAGLGYPVTSADRAAQLRVHGVTPDFIRRAQSRGFKDLTLDQMIRLRIAGILDEP